MFLVCFQVSFIILLYHLNLALFNFNILSSLLLVSEFLNSLSTIVLLQENLLAKLDLLCKETDVYEEVLDRGHRILVFECH